MSLFDLLCVTHWMMEPEIFDKMRAIVERHEDGIRKTPEQIEAAIGRVAGTPNPRNRKYEVDRGVALIPVQGVISKHASGAGDISAPKGVSAEEIQENLRVALADSSVTSILMHIESGGGQVDGTQATADAIAAASKIKPTWALIDGMGCSAAYWMAASCSKVLATNSALVGSIGVISAVRDTSQAAAKMGVKTIVIRSGPHKATGQPGEEITDAMLKPKQDIVNGMAAQFYAAVSQMRGITGADLDAVTDGKVWLAPEALALGLIDGISDVAQAIADLSDPSKAHASLPPRSPVSALSGASIKTHAGDRPAATKERMSTDITLARLKELQKQHPAHAQVILDVAGDAAGKPAASVEAEILAAIQAKESANLTATIQDMRSQLDQNLAHLTTLRASKVNELAAKDLEISELKAQLSDRDTKLAALSKGNKALAGNGIPDPKGAAAAAVDADPIKAFNAKVEEYRKSGIVAATQHAIGKHPDLHAAFLDAVNGGAA